MTRTAASRGGLTPANYWQVRKLELLHAEESLRRRIADCRTAQTEVLRLWRVAKSGSPEWEGAIVRAKSAVRMARTERTRLMNLVANCRDTCRIRKHLADALPDEVDGLLTDARALCDVMEGQGY